MESIKVGVYGGTGYTGWALIQILLIHPNVEIKFVTSERMAGENLKNSWVLAPDMTLVSSAEANLEEVDCVFLCLPHTRSAEIAALAKQAGKKVIDLSADLRLKDVKVYEEWYKVKHAAPDLLPVVYGLPEHYRDEIKKADLVANPGCYATSMLLGLYPLAKNHLLIDGAPIIVDAKSGTTGAGRNPKQHILFSEVHGNFSAYSIGRSHRHLSEVEQQLEEAGLKAGNLIFSPHLLPTDRGILSTIYVQVKNADDAMVALKNAYANEALIHILPEGELASLAHVVRTPFSAISFSKVNENNLIILVAIDNLLKGAASQAVQNFNLIFDLEETTGLI
jgi:N-acetyl-gamma-glutamyl-phosphate reductase